MAFNLNNNQGNQAQGNGNTNEDKWKAVGFLNVYLPARDGTRVKLGTLPLKASKPREKELAELLINDPDLIKAVVARLQVEFNSAEPSDGKGFDLS